MSRHGEYLELIWNGEVPSEYVRGHVDGETFTNAVRPFCGKAGIELLGKSRHAHARFVPTQTDEFDTRIVDCGPGPGAFKVTVADYEPPGAGQ